MAHIHVSIVSKIKNPSLAYLISFIYTDLTDDINNCSFYLVSVFLMDSSRRRRSVQEMQLYGIVVL
jgi:hypothetical protein